MQVGPNGTPAALLPRYERTREEVLPPIATGPYTSFRDAAAAIEGSPLSPGARALLTGLLRLGAVKVFAGGGVGIEYGSLLKTAARPEYIGAHIAEAAAHLQEARVDLLLVPGMSGYPVGSMYALASGLPAVLLKKGRIPPEGLLAASFPPGAFVIPSYTGEGDVVISADLDAVQDIVDGIVEPQLATQHDEPHPTLSMRAAGADDIIDKATMSRAVSESAVAVGQAAIDDFVRRHRAATGDQRPIAVRVEVVAWVTPLIKGYNRPHEHLARAFGIRPFAGINVTGVQLDPPAIGVDGLGMLGFATRGS